MIERTTIFLNMLYTNEAYLILFTLNWIIWLIHFKKSKHKHSIEQHALGNESKAWTSQPTRTFLPKKSSWWWNKFQSEEKNQKHKTQHWATCIREWKQSMKKPTYNEDIPAEEVVMMMKQISKWRRLIIIKFKANTNSYVKTRKKLKIKMWQWNKDKFQKH